MIRTFATILLVLGACVVARPVEAAEPDAVIRVWPDAPPAWQAPQGPERDATGPDGRLAAGRRVTRLTDVTKPELHVYRGSGSTTMLICPGGGYSILAWDLEGTEIAEWFQDAGVTAVVLKYRVPTRRGETAWMAPVQDIQRSVSLLRAGGIEGIAPQRVGVLGFSAGGNAAARAATATKRHYNPIDANDQVSASPDFAVLIYPAWLVQEDEPTKLIDEIEIGTRSPPMFFAHAVDDRISCMSSLTMFSELKKHGVAGSLHLFASGGHGFGGRESGAPTDAWLDLCRNWMSNQGWLDP